MNMYEYILRSGSAGYTDQELSDALNLTSDVVRHRRTTLLQTGQIISSRFLRRNASGRRATVWITSKVMHSLNHNQARLRLY
jgi:hypothetical protein